MSLRAGCRVEEAGGRFSVVHRSPIRMLAGGMFLPFALGALNVGLAGELKLASGAPFPTWLTLVVAGVLAAMGLSVMLYRSGVDFHLLRDEVEFWSGYGRGRPRKRLELSSVTEVSVHREVRSSGSNGGSSTYYPVRLVCGGDPVTVFDHVEELAARRLAETIARAIERPLRNGLFGEDIVRPAAQLDWSVRRRLVHERAIPSEVELPDRSALHVTCDDEGTVIDIPPAGALRGGLVLAALGLPGIMVFMAVSWSFISDAPLFFLVPFVSIAFAPFLFLAVLAVRRGLVRERLVVSSSAFAFTRQWPWRTETQNFDPEKIEEIAVSSARLGPLSGIIARGGLSVFTDDAVLRFGLGATEADRDAVRDLLFRALCTPQERAAAAAVSTPDPDRSERPISQSMQDRLRDVTSDPPSALLDDELGLDTVGRVD